MENRISRNALINVVGVVLPTLVGVLSVPILLRNLGSDRLGVFTLALGLVGFAGIFDLGLGRALTQTVATAAGRGTPFGAIALHLFRILPIVLLMGVGWGAALWFSAELVAHSVFRLDGAIAAETVKGIRWLALAIPCLLLSSSLIGSLEGLQRFGLVNLVRVPLGMLAFAGPALASYFWRHVGDVIGVLVGVRLLGLVVWLWAIMRVLPMRRPGNHERLSGGAMWRFTGWLTISNIVGPMMVHADRFYLASIFAPAIVARYTVPLDTLLRATALPLAAVNTLFPALAHVGAASAEAGQMVRGAAWGMLGLWAIPILLAGMVLEWLLTLWLGAEFAAQAIDVSRWLLLGVLVNGFAHIPYALLQSAGRADLTAKLHVLELPLYAVLIVGLVSAFGIVGAAMAWSARVAFDCLLLYGLACWRFTGLRRTLGLAATMALVSMALLGGLYFVGQA